MALSTTFTILATATQTNALDLGTGTIPLAIGGRESFEDGSGAGQAQKVFSDTRTIAASGTDALDLAGVLTNAFGATITFATIKGIIVEAADANTNNVIVGGGTTTLPLFSDASDKLPVKPGGKFAWECPGTGVAVGAGSTDLFELANSGGTTGVTFNILIVGT